MWLEKGIDEGKLDVGWGIGQRYLADTLCETAIAVGHRLINLVVRVMRTDPHTQQRMDALRVGRQKPLAPLGSTYKPFQTEVRGAWLSLNATTISHLRAVASPHADLADAVTRLADLDEQRFGRGNLQPRVSAMDCHDWLDVAHPSAVPIFDPATEASRRTARLFGAAVPPGSSVARRHVSTIFLRFSGGSARATVGKKGDHRVPEIVTYLHEQGRHGKRWATSWTCGNAVPTS
ncbi:hypothetical protein ABZW96_31100 [Nocardia sp. NPDC004168]|uniref:hypothetical protein n=1 Tax=Nocardia sp. NPDC004168 TaxID=3154452 RepID=UPI0033B4A579